MSVEATNWVWKHSQSRGAARLVLLAIADFGNESHQAWPSMETLTKKTALGERTVHRAIAQLIKMGELRIEYNAGPRLCNLYQVVLTPAVLAPLSERHPRQSGTPVNSAGVPSGPARGAIHDTKGVPERHPEPSVEPPENHQEPQTLVEQARPLAVIPGGFSDDPADILDVWDTWKASTGKQRSEFSPVRRDAIVKALAKYPLQDVLDAVQGHVYDPWPDRPQQNDIVQLLHMGTKRKPHNTLEKMRDLWRDGPPAVMGKHTTQTIAFARQMATMRPAKEVTTDDVGRMDGDRALAQRQLSRPEG